MDSQIINMYDLYQEYENIETKKQINKCECGNNNLVPDDNYCFFVCQDCGSCVEHINNYVLNYCDYGNYIFPTKKRYYKKTTYLRLKINNIFRNKKPILPDEYINILKKKAVMNMRTIVKYMKKNKLIKLYDPLKSLYKIKSIPPIYLTEYLLNKLIKEFIKKEITYREHGIFRINYNHTILKIFQEIKQTDMYICFDSIQDKKIIDKHNTIYNKIFN